MITNCLIKEWVSDVLSSLISILKVLTFSGLSIIDGYFGSIKHHIFPLPALLSTLAISAWANTQNTLLSKLWKKKHTVSMVVKYRGLRLPRLLHPSLQANMPTGLFDLQCRRVCLFSAQSLWKVSGVLGWQTAGGRKTRWAFRVTQGVTLCNTTKREG